MGAAHGFKDLDDYILSLIRNQAFPDKVNDIVVKCGNCLYQDISWSAKTFRYNPGS
jgi:hypothetical protein